MTIEKAIEILKYNSNVIHKTINGETDPNEVEALDMAIKALEQEPILDKVRAEIDKIYEREGNSVDCLNALNELKQFIDKYKAESEDKE